MKSEEQKNNERPRLFFRVFRAGAILLVLYYFVVAMPQGMIYKRKLQSLHPDQAQTVHLHTEVLVNGKVITRERILKGNEKSEFLALISDSRSFSPNHSRGGWTCYVDIVTTTDVPRFSFLIHSTSNNGVYLDLGSLPNGAGWNYGALRNDALGPFIEGLFRKQPSTAP